MEKQCVKQCWNCKYSGRPSKGCACNVKAKHELDKAEPMKLNGNGMPYCDSFKQAFKDSK